MLYHVLKIPARFAFKIYCRSIHVSGEEILSHKGPLLIACNHPNSFLDAIIISTLFDKPVYSLARGDVFDTPLKRFFLKELNMFPVYRTSEGVENLEHNYATFDACHQIFKKNGIVLIFSEGSCFNEWHLRPLKKGTARLALSSWEKGIPLKILPAGVNYHSFTSFGKNLSLNFGHIIENKHLPVQESFGRAIYDFNQELKSRMQPLVYEFKKTEKELLRKKFEFKVPRWKRVLLAIPAALGYLIHAPLYIPLKTYTKKVAGNNDHYDSILIGLLFGFYPIYLLLVCLFTYFLTGSAWSLLIFIILPFSAWSFVQLKKQF